MTHIYKLIFQIKNGDDFLTGNQLEDQLCAHAVSVTKHEEAENLWTIESYFEHSPEPEAIQAFLETNLPAAEKIPDFHIESLPDEDWVTHVQSNLCPVEAGRFVIHGSHDQKKLKSQPFAIQIDAGQAFGTAHHGTTKGCLIAIERVLKRTPVHNILDIGTGTGVLAIAAAKMQKTAQVCASDIDPLAVKVAQENTRINHVSHLVKLLHATGLEHPKIKEKKPYDLIIANILAKPLQMLSPDIAKVIKAGGYIILSGLLVTQAREVTASYLQNNFSIDGRIALEGWMTLIMKKNKSALTL